MERMRELYYKKIEELLDSKKALDKISSGGQGNRQFIVAKNMEIERLENDVNELEKFIITFKGGIF